MSYESQPSRRVEWRFVVGLEIDVSDEIQPRKQAEWRLVAGLEIDVSYEPQPRIIQIGWRFKSMSIRLGDQQNGDWLQVW